MSFAPISTKLNTEKPTATLLFSLWAKRLEQAAIVIVLLAMMMLPSLESFARRLCQTSIPGAVLYAQHLTLWLGFLGALLATAGIGKHLALSKVERFSTQYRPIVRWYGSVLSAGVCIALAYASTVLVQADLAQQSLLPGGIPTWFSEVIMPVASGLMAWRFIYNSALMWRGRILSVITIFLCGALIYLVLPTSVLISIGIVAIILGLIVGAPVFVAMAGLGMLLFFSADIPIAAVPAETFRLVASATLPALPLLTVTGYVITAGGASNRLLRLVRALVGFMPGGSALIVCLVCAVFTAFTGGSGVTILALGGLVLPMLIAEGYPKGFSHGLVTSAGSLGLLFPPSLPVILYAIVAQANVEDLFIAGVVPGMLLVAMVATYGIAAGVRYKAKRQAFNLKELCQATWHAKWELIIPLIVVFTVFTGFATIVEAAAIALLSAIVSQCFILKDIHPIRDLPGVIINAVTLVGAVLIVLGVAMGLTSYLVDAEIPAFVLSWAQQHLNTQVIFLLVLNFVLLILGSVLEVYSAIIVLAPLLAPLAAAYDINPLHLGIIFLANLELGFLFPPIGLNLILASSRFSQPLTHLYRVTLPFLLVRIVGVLLITYVPFISIGFLDWIRGF
ncbi:MAG: TRAP transporter large permease subunit [Deltaproteobacteria bacterium]|nr:TRAP transporter large permease subunit [Deltaproteobacteria bacterium]